MASTWATSPYGRNSWRPGRGFASEESAEERLTSVQGGGLHPEAVRQYLTTGRMTLPFGTARTWRQDEALRGGPQGINRDQYEFRDIMPGSIRKDKGPKVKKERRRWQYTSGINDPMPNRWAGQDISPGGPVGDWEGQEQTTDMDVRAPSWVSEEESGERRHYLHDVRVGRTADEEVGGRGAAINATSRDMPNFVSPGPRPRGLGTGPRALGMPEGGRQKRPGMSDRARMGLRQDWSGL